jgi:glycogen debranching enzyme
MVKSVLRKCRAALHHFRSGRRAIGSLLLLALAVALAPASSSAQRDRSTVPRFSLDLPSIRLQRSVTPAAFFDVVGRRAAAFGYEGRPLEAWVYPIKVLDEFQLLFALDGYPVPIPAAELPATIDVRPEATIFTYTHAAFTVREILIAPIDAPGLMVLLDVQTTLPMTVVGRFRPALRLMWPAPSQTPNTSWDANAHVYELTEDTGRIAAIVGVPDGDDRSVMPYQEEPRDRPLEFSVPITPDEASRRYFPVIVTASMAGRAAARAAYTDLAQTVEQAYRSTAAHYRDLLNRSVAVHTPDARVNEAFKWAVVGMDKGFAVNPTLGTGLLAGFRTSGNSERPGFAWFFGRDALWTAIALTAAGAGDGTRTALDFLERYQRDDGRIPHEIAQSAGEVPWFTAYPYAWASADATPLFVIAHADYWRASGDRAFLDAHWTAIRKAYGFSAATDRDANGLIDNTGIGHGWVEGGALYPAHEELYLQGIWVEASRSFAELADVMGDHDAAQAARGAAERTRQTVEDTYWIGDRGFYAFGTSRPGEARQAEPGPDRERRQRRLDALRSAHAIDEDTVLPAVPMWWRQLDPARADLELDHLGSGAMASDWGHRLLSERSELYDPLSYHYGSVWPLFTGWASMAAYRYGRPHVGEQALFANVLLTEPGALGYITELLSGEFNAAFGRSSHHQIWSEAMVVTPLVRGLLGIETSDGGSAVRIAPQLPADWTGVEVRHIPAGNGMFSVDVTRANGLVRVQVARESGGAMPRLSIAPALPLDVTLIDVRVDGRIARPAIVRAGDVQFAGVEAAPRANRTEAVYRFTGGSDVYIRHDAPLPGARSTGIRILRSRADARALRVMVEGRNGHEYELFLHTPRAIASVEGARLRRVTDGDSVLEVPFGGPEPGYVRRNITVLFDSGSMRRR